MTALKCFSKLVKVVRSVFKLVGFKLHALLVQPKHIITNYKVDSRWSLINHYYCWCTFRLPKTQWGCSGFQVTRIIEGFFGFEFLIPVFFFCGEGGGGILQVFSWVTWYKSTGIFLGIQNNLKIHGSACMSGCVSSAWDFLGFCFLPPYDHPHHLKFGVRSSAPKSQATHICT